MSIPEGWNKTIEDLISEKKMISGEEIEWAREYEKSLLGDSIRFPQVGDIYESLVDVQISYITHWAAPYTGGEKFILKKGEKLRIKAAGSNQPIGVYADSLNYENIEKEIVPEKDRNSDKYSGFSLFVRTLTLNNQFKLIVT